MQMSTTTRNAARRWVMLMLLCTTLNAWADEEGFLASLFGRNALWKNVQERCLKPDAPRHPDCAAVDRDKGLVLYKDAIGRSHFLVIPDRPMRGVDDIGAWEDGTPNQWAFGWDARAFVGKARGQALPDSMLGLAINAKASRSQDQLHIHLDCISTQARDFVSGAGAPIGTTWTDLQFRGKPVKAIFVPSASASMSVNPFLLIKRRLGDAAPPVPDRGVFVAYVAGEQGQAGFVVVDQPVDREAGSNGHASDFLDRQCELATGRQPGARR
jgi:CDP-diacylglycerol pyrophosphatase